MGLTIVHAPEPIDNEGIVVFFARVFQKGKECSFVERATFQRVRSIGWTYCDGVLRPASHPLDPEFVHDWIR